MKGARPIADGGVAVLSGMVGGATGLAGILPTIWSTLRGWTKDEQRAVFQPAAVAIFAGTALWLGGTASFDRDAMRLFAIGLPALAAGHLGWLEGSMATSTKRPSAGSCWSCCCCLASL